MVVHRADDAVRAGVRRGCRTAVPRLHRVGTQLRPAVRRGPGPNPDNGTDGAQPDSTSTLWVRDNPPRPLDFPALTSLCDVFYPRAFLRLGRFVPAGTVSLTVYFHADATMLAAQADDAVLGTARAQRFGKGYFDQSGEIWGRDGALLATTHQLVYFKD
ncbi:thioesterase family protein [Prescottella defluvii]|nr:thioesterase family protein [Prescottella defluvii]